MQRDWKDKIASIEVLHQAVAPSQIAELDIVKQISRAPLLLFSLSIHLKVSDLN